MSKEKTLEEYRKKFGLCDGSLKHCGCKRELDFILKAIDQTREETIREVEAEMKNIYNDEEGRGNWEYTIGYKERNNEVLDILNKLKK